MNIRETKMILRNRIDPINNHCKLCSNKRDRERENIFCLPIHSLIGDSDYTKEHNFLSLTISVK